MSLAHLRCSSLSPSGHVDLGKLASFSPPWFFLCQVGKRVLRALNKLMCVKLMAKEMSYLKRGALLPVKGL